ncbi:MAG: hypothetical protein IJS15_11240, partial [Victivallales bacterium]|nr:hypothetical protein [Victivallales bacterium]
MTDTNSDNGNGMPSNTYMPPPLPNGTGHPQCKGRNERRKTGCLVGIIIAAVSCMVLFFFTCFIVVMILGVAATLEDGDFRRLDSSTDVIAKGSKDVIAVMDVKGIITSSEASNAVIANRFIKTLKKIESDSNVVALILDMDT